jgi:TP901 family phage tail tape measure protein
MDDKKVLLQFIYETVGAQQAIQADKAVKAQMSKVILAPSGKPAALEVARQTAPFAQTAQQKGLLMMNPQASPQIIMPSGYIAGMNQNFQSSRGVPYNPPQQLRLPNYSQKPLQLPNYSQSQLQLPYYPSTADTLKKKSGFQDMGKVDISSVELGKAQVAATKYNDALNLLNIRKEKGTISTNSYNNAILKMNQTLGINIKTTNGVSDATKKAEIDVGKLVSRALVTIPVWMALRAVFMSVIGAVQDTIKAYGELDAGMAKVMAVASYTGDNQKRTYVELEHAARQYFANSTAGFTDITQAMYELGSAGRSTKEMLVGFKHIMDLSVGSYTDVTTAARSVAGILNVFDKELDKVGNSEEKIKYITDNLAYAWKEHQIEVVDITQAFQYLGPVAAQTGVSFKEMLAAVGTMGDVMLRGGKGGRLLASAIGEMAQNSDKLVNLGIIFDPYKPLKFYDIMKQLNEIYKTQGKSLETNNTFLEIFGKEGSRAIVDVLANWEKFNLEIQKSPEEIAKTAKAMEELSKGTWAGLGKRLWRQLTTGGETAPEGGSGLKNIFKTIIGNMEDTRQRGNTLVEMYKTLGDKLKLTKVEASLLSDELRSLGQTSYANSVLGKAGLMASITRSDLDLKGRSDVVKKIKDLYKIQEEEIKKQETNLKNQEIVDQSSKPFSSDVLKKFQDIRDMSREDEMKYAGLSDADMRYQDVIKYAKDLNDLQNGRWNTQKLITAFLKEDANTLKDMGVGVSQIEEGFKKVEEHQKQLLKDALVYKDTIRSSLTEGISNVMSGTGNVRDIFSGLQNTMIEGYRKTVSEGFSSILMGSGIGDIFGGAMTKLKEAFGLVQQKVEDKLDLSNQYLSGILNNTGGGTPTTTTGTSTAGSGVTGSFGGLLGLGASKAAGWMTGSRFNTATGKYETTATQKPGESTEAWLSRQQEALAKAGKGQYVAGGIVTGTEAIMTGYNAYQSAKAGGASAAGSAMSGVGAAGMVVGGAIVAASERLWLPVPEQLLVVVY